MSQHNFVLASLYAAASLASEPRTTAELVQAIRRYVPLIKDGRVQSEIHKALDELEDGDE